MSVFYKIEGNTVKRVREEVEKTVDLAEFVAGIEENVPVESGMLPRNCIYFSQRFGRFAYVVEIPAQLVAVCTPRREGGHNQYKIHIPFTQFYVGGNPMTKAIGNIFLTATHLPLTSLNDKVFIAPYPNIFNTGVGHLCTGTMAIPSDISLDAKVNAVCGEFFTAAFNSDLQPGCPEGWSWSRGVDPYMAHWQELTERNRCLMLGDAVKLQQHPETPSNIIANLLRGSEG